jgi:hypothetical protein
MGDECYTPHRFVDCARESLGVGAFDLDPCSSLQANQVVLAKNYYTKADDGLARKWNARSVWMNPPYSKPLPWVQRLTTMGMKTQWACFTTNDTSVPWSRLLFATASYALFVAGRHHFWGPDVVRTSNNKGHVLWLKTSRPIDVIARAMDTHEVDGDLVSLATIRRVRRPGGEP